MLWLALRARLTLAVAFIAPVGAVVGCRRAGRYVRGGRVARSVAAEPRGLLQDRSWRIVAGRDCDDAGPLREQAGSSRTLARTQRSAGLIIRVGR